MSHSHLNNGPKPPENEGAEGQDESRENGGTPGEVGGRKGPDPTRYGDWEIGGKCVDF